MATERRRTKSPQHNMTLKEKFRDHWQTRNFEASEQTISVVGVSIVWVNTTSLVLEGFLLLLPHFFSTDANDRPQHNGKSVSTGLVLSKILTLYLFVGTICQWFYVRDVSLDKVYKKTGQDYDQHRELPEGWRYCGVCRLNCPPRSHHCDLCDACILKRDHHCYFSGSCVGYHNQRHFIIFLIYAFLASVYGVFMQGAYLINEAGGTYLIPLVALWKTLACRGRVLHLVVLLHLYVSTAIAVTCVSFISWQVKIILRGQTSYEAMIGSTKYVFSASGGTRGVVTKSARQCRFDNFSWACGSPLEFALCVLVPVLRLKLKGDGIHWTT